jgi:hypothetical protein
MLVGWLTMLLICLTPIVLLLFALRNFLGNRPPSARDLLDQAYARGELSRDEYFEETDDPAQR